MDVSLCTSWALHEGHRQSSSVEETNYKFANIELLQTTEIRKKK